MDHTLASPNSQALFGVVKHSLRPYNNRADCRLFVTDVAI